MANSDIRLGLIGDKIARSRAPELHRIAGRLCGWSVTYDLLVPPERGETFDQVFDAARDGGCRGLNITYPYKEVVMRRLADPPPALRQLGACNSVVFGQPGPTGINTDSTGFASGFRARFPGERPGIVAMAGTGGVGKAIAFALPLLGTTELRLVDPDAGKARALAEALAPVAGAMRVTIATTMRDAADGSDGLINATPLGMDGIGNAIPDECLPGRRWAFDAVYTPEETPFLGAAAAKDLAVMSGFELFLFQGVDAFAFFTGTSVDASALRAELRRPG
jgi:shikimate dehydrogenase